MKQFDSASTVLIATFSPWKNGKRLPINGNLEPMRDFFVPRTKKTVIIDQVYPDSDFVLPKTEVYRNGSVERVLHAPLMVAVLKPILSLFNKPGTHIVYKVRDFLSVICECYRHKEVFTYFVGFEAINAAAGILMKRLRRVKHVIYYVSDYSPYRYGNTWFNRLYVWLDRWCVEHADVVWDVSPAMQPARIKVGLDREKSAPVLIVPNALYKGQINQVPNSKVVPDSLVYIGTFGLENGPDLAIRALSIILGTYPKASLHFYGGPTESEHELKKLAENLKIAKHIKFYGFITDRFKLSKSIKNYAVALAPYRNIQNSVRKYADATKIRAYFASGIPVVTTSVPPLGKEAAKKGAAVVSKDTPEELASAVTKLFGNKRVYENMRTKAYEFAHANTWDNEYWKAFKAIEGL